MTNLSPGRQEAVRQGSERWRALSEEQRQRISRNFDEFFGLTSEERQKALNQLSKPELAAIEKTLQSFQGLPPEKRRRCIQSFDRFLAMGPDERLLFLRNAKRWEQMTPSERKSWEDVVEKASAEPPLPLDADLPPVPRLPHPVPHRTLPPTASTNRP